MPRKVTVVISQAQGKNPAKRQLEEEIAARLIMEPDVDCSIVPHLYDMAHDHTGLLFLRSVPGDVVVLSWLYPRAAFWSLDRAGVRGRWGTSLLVPDEEEDERDESERPAPPTGRDAHRSLYCIDLRGDSDPEVYLEEIQRIAGESSVETVDLMSWIKGDPSHDLLQRYLKPAGSNGNGSNGNGHPPTGPRTEQPAPALLFDASEDEAKRRWYPVIDYDRCTNCMECIDFCLFGVYGVDGLDTILVEQQDNCKKGCPACSRVCPENAIIFPGHKTAAIAGADGDVGGLKIDLSKLFGGDTKDALDLAVAERDAELVADGREAVGMAVGIPKRQTAVVGERDELDDLIDGLDDFDV
jgi:NAD-dependent dihydropyrimidine dehydrogenase PreA subunit